MISKEQKVEILENLRENFKTSKIIVFVNFHGLSVVSASKLRSMFKEIDAKYLVAKKTLIKKVLEENGYTDTQPDLEGEIGLAFANEEVSIEMTKKLNDFAQENNIKLIGGVFENKYIDADTVVVFANIPSREVLLAQLVYMLNSPIKGMAVTLNGVVGNFVNVLDEIKKVRS